MNFKRLLVMFLFIGGGLPLLNGQDAWNDRQDMPIIKKITIEGSKHIKKDAVLRRLPYKVGEPFDKEKTADAINLVYDLGYFRQVTIEKEEVGDNFINLYVVVEERKLLEKITFFGNKAIKSKKILSKLKLDKLETIDEEQLKR